MKVSVSQIDKFRSCQRKIGFDYVEGIKAPPSTKQTFGKSVHAQLENWLRNGVLPDNSPAGLCAKQGIKTGWLPAPNKNLLVEYSYNIPWLRGVRMAGYIDCVVPKEEGDEWENSPIVIDHKTTSDLRYAMTKNELRENPQAVIYAVWAMLHFQTDKVRARWIYFSSSNPKGGHRKPTGAKPVEVLFDASSSDFQTEVKYLIAEAARIVHIRESGVKGLELPANPSSCEHYGGCFYADICSLSPDERIEAYFSKEEMKEKVRK